jgi:hypothetical protein
MKARNDSDEQILVGVRHDHRRVVRKFLGATCHAASVPSWAREESRPSFATLQDSTPGAQMSRRTDATTGTPRILPRNRATRGDMTRHDPDVTPHVRRHNVTRRHEPTR